MKQPVHGTVPVGSYSPGILAEGRYVFVSGQGPERDGVTVHGTIEEETELTLDNVAAVLAAAGASFAYVVRCGVFLADIADFDRMDAIYRRRMPEPRPARTTVGAQLGGGIKVEIDCVALVPAEV